MIRQMLAAGRTMYFEYYEVDPLSEAATSRDIARAEFLFLLLHTGALLPGNLKADGLSLFPDAATRPRGDPKSQSSKSTHGNGLKFASGHVYL